VFYWTSWQSSLRPRLITSNSPIKWKRTLDARLTSPPVIGSDGTIYIATFGGLIYALDPSGAVRWTYYVNLNDIPSALLRDSSDNVYFTTTTKVFSLTACGRKRWETECTAQPAYPGAVQQAALTHNVLLTTCNDNFSALNTTDGRELWKLSQPFFEYNTPIVLRTGAIVLAHGSSLMAIDQNGNSLWNFPPPNYIEPRPRPGLVVDQMFFSSPIAAGLDGSLYLGSGDGEFSSFSANGELNWTYNAGPLRGIRFDASPVIASDGTVIALSNERSAYALTTGGEVRWSVHVGDRVRNMIPISPVLGSDGTIYVLAAGKLVELSPAGETVQEVPLAADAVVSPTLAPDGTLYIATDNRSLYAVETTSKGLMNSPWPKYQRDLSNSGSSF
jgi:outer membrane protein assembly factor BamB